MNNVFFSGSRVFQTAARIVDKLRTAGYAGYFVGGAVRDMLLGKTPKDIDIATSATPQQAAEIFPRHYKIGVAFGILMIVEDDIPFELATFREEREYADGRHPETVKYTDSPELDAARRDFTINGMFYDPAANRILDFTGGQRDLEKGVIKTIGNAEQRFSEDYLRMLRAVRFTTRLGFELDREAADAILKLKHNLNRLSAERVRDELNLMLTGGTPAAAIRLLHKLGLLELALPEVAALDGVTQPEQFHPEGDVLTHTLLMLDHMPLPGIELAWSILLHDAGKPSTYSVGEDRIEHFYRHEEASAVIAESCLNRLKFSRKIMDTVVHAVKNHMRFAMVDRMRPPKLKRLIAEEDFPLQLELHRIDCISSHSKLGNYLLLLDSLHQAGGETALPEPLVNGRDLMAAGLKPGPRMGKILRQIAEMQLAGEISTQEDAIAFARHFPPD
ncbi:MAG: CCA tRNA nucleotidyltransferase [Victivallaceae bacterium]|jgi:poly(A) polymerase